MPKLFGTHQRRIRSAVVHASYTRWGGASKRRVTTSSVSETRSVVVGPREELQVSRVTSAQVLWRGAASVPVTAAVRYRMPPVPAVATIADDGRLVVDFESVLYGVAPGQSVVCYDGDRVLGGGVIACAS